MVFCFDATGKKCGIDIVPRVNRKLTKELGQQRAVVLIESAKFDVKDAVHEWWPPVWSGTEENEDTQNRVREFLSFIRDCESKIPIIVGHSQFFKAFYSSRISKVLSNSQPETSANMQRYRLGNGTVLAVTVSFVGSEAEIVDADILFEGSESQWVS
jgi:broad specificity phosphatase PhoE